LQLTRKRVRESIYERTTELCATCKGRGFVRSASDVAVETLERLRAAMRVTKDETAVRVQVPTRVAAVLRDQLAGAVRDLGHEFGVTIDIRDDARLTQAFADAAPQDPYLHDDGDAP
jgi:hypothetical protein